MARVDLEGLGEVVPEAVALRVAVRKVMDHMIARKGGLPVSVELVGLQVVGLQGARKAVDPDEDQKADVADPVVRAADVA